MWRFQEIIIGVKQSLDAAREARERAAERNELAQIRELCSAHYGKSISSVLADLSSGRMMTPKPRQGFSNEASSQYYQPRPPHHQQQQLGSECNHDNKNSPPANQILGGSTPNRQSAYNPRNVSKNAFVNGAAIYKASDGPLCFGCGQVEHIKPKCQNPQLQNCEQIHLKNIIYELPQPSRESNFVYYGRGYGRCNDNQEYRRPLNSPFDLHDNPNTNHSSRFQDTIGHCTYTQERPQFNSTFGYRSDDSGASQHNFTQLPMRPGPQGTPRDEPEGSWRVPPKVHLEDQQDADCSMSQFANIKIPEDQSQQPESKACELDVQIQSFSSGRDKKRQRIGLRESDKRSVGHK
ncbi:hypothetical protein K3495_g11986 [Podosphaera aphanis]|nr:hypothetical protein K3495_g11986 [Podosphaera aphanis]